MCATMWQSSQILGMEESNNNGGSSSSNKRIGLPPSHPNNDQVFGSLGGSGVGLGQSHMRSLSMFSSLDSLLPPLHHHPFVPAAVAMEEKGGLLHRRSMSDTVPLGFCSMLQPSPQMVPVPGQGGGGFDFVKQEQDDGEGVGERRRRGEGELGGVMLNGYVQVENKVDQLNSSDDKNELESSDNEAESRVKGLKRSADADIGPAGRHSRSVSMDSFMGGLRLEDESMMKLVLGGNQAGQLNSPSSSILGRSFSKQLVNGEFTEGELKKIVANDKLAELAIADPKRVKRILANRLSAARSKERKVRYVSELEQKVQTLQAEATSLSAQVAVFQRDSSNLISQNNELQFRLQAIEQQSQLKDALNEALVAEVQRLRLAAAEQGGPAAHGHHHHQQQQLLLSANHPLMQQQQQQQQNDMSTKGFMI